MTIHLPGFALNERLDTGFPAEAPRVYKAGPDSFMHFPLRDEPRTIEPKPSVATKARDSWELLLEERRRYG